MADLLVIAELTPPPHNACRLGFDDRQALWLGLQPYWGDELSEWGRGRVETRPRTHEHHHFVRFSVDGDDVLEKARREVFQEWDVGRRINEHNYEADTYVPFVVDCVSFARDVAEACGLKASVWYDHPVSRIDLVPQELLVKLYHYNEDRVIESNLTSLGTSTG